MRRPHRRTIALGVVAGAVILLIGVGLYELSVLSARTDGTTLSSTSSAAIKTALRDFFARCAEVGVASPAGCPQSSTDSGTDFRWSLVGDPAASIDVSNARSGSVDVVGHYLMLYSFSGQFPNGIRHRVEGGPYDATAAVNGSSITIERVVAASRAPKLRAPAGVTAADLRSSVAQAFKACIAAPADGSPDCPQFDFAPTASKFQWSINGDPVADTTVEFDADQGFWKVMGNYSFHDSFDAGAAGHQEHDVNGTYFAYVVYDGHTLITVYIRHI